MNRRSIHASADSADCKDSSERNTSLFVVAKRSTESGAASRRPSSRSSAVISSPSRSPVLALAKNRERRASSVNRSNTRAMVSDDPEPSVMAFLPQRAKFYGRDRIQVGVVRKSGGGVVAGDAERERSDDAFHCQSRSLDTARIADEHVSAPALGRRVGPHCEVVAYGCYTSSFDCRRRAPITDSGHK